MRKLLLTAAIIFTATVNINAQGCVAIKSNGGYCSMTNHDTKKYTLNINHRYFRSYKHFVGTAEQKQRIQLGNEVVNYAHTTDFNLNKNFKQGWSAAIDVPIIVNNRSSLYEHGGKIRNTTKSFGLGDVRLAAYKWLIDPVRMSKANIQLGAGLKLPTGDYKFQDKYSLTDSTSVTGPVDQSIQLGDGGLGFTTEINTYYNFSKNFTAYGNFYYLINPREQNGVIARGYKTATTLEIRSGADIMSVPDQYMVRAGLNYTVKQLTISGGIRKECLTVKDLFGGNNGFRRPGYIVSAEPGITYEFKNLSFYTFVPFAVKRNRTQSVPDKNRTKITGVYTQGDAAFADYAINIGLTVKF